jgi:hypothetical protein
MSRGFLNRFNNKQICEHKIENIGGMKMKLLPIIMVCIIIISGLGVFVVLNKEKTLSERDSDYNTCESGVISTDRKTYDKGEPVKIRISGNWTWSSSDLGWGYVVKDKKGHWVKDPPMLTTCDIRVTNGTLYYIWNQKYRVTQEYDLHGNHRVHYPNNGEQVPPGIYYIHFLLNEDEFVEIEIADQN